MDGDDSCYSETIYLVAKCINFDSLKRCEKTKVWACRERDTPPQPKAVIDQGLSNGRVILIYSVNNCHGWHGYAEIQTSPGTVSAEEYNQILKQSKVTNTPDDSPTNWLRFKIKNECFFQSEHGQRCLPFTDTESLRDTQNEPVNKARNNQEISSIVGEAMCRLIDARYKDFSEIKLKKEEEKLRNLPEQFFKPGNEQDPKILWEKLIVKVEELGKVILACVFGSQRYNLNNESSDVDMFVVYAAQTTDVLGFSAPQQTIKNRNSEICDYTIHEVYRYCELLFSGDPRCVETLFLHPSTIYYQSTDWQLLCEHRELFLTRLCAEKYMNDALGAKGTRQLDKWIASGMQLENPLPQKMAKLFYIIFRLLQNAQDILKEHTLKVYREDGSVERDFLMQIRSGKYSFDELKMKLDETLKYLQLLKKEPNREELENVKKYTENWLFKLRFENLKFHMETF